MSNPYLDAIPPNALQKAGSGLADGTLVCTSSPRSARWILTRDYRIAPDDIRAIAAVGGGAWVRDLVSGSPGANFEPTWYVDQKAGNNLNVGTTPGAAVKDLEEIMARLGQQPIDDTLGSTGMVVKVAAGYKSSSKIVLSPRIERLGNLTIDGLPGVVTSGNLTGSVKWSPDTGSIGSYSVSGFSPSSYVGQFVQTGNGLTSPIAKATDTSFRGLWLDPSTYSSSEPAAGDVLQVLSLPRIAADAVFAPTGDGYLIVRGFDLGEDGSHHTLQTISGNTLFLASTVRGLDAQRGTQSCNLLGCYTLDCRAHGCSMLIGSTVHSNAGGAVLATDDEGTIDILDLVLAEGTVQAGRYENGKGHILVADGCALAVADYVSAGVLVRQGSQVDVYGDVFLVDAVAGAGAYGYQVVTGGRVYYMPGKLPKLYGALPVGTGYRVGGIDIPAESLPTVSPGGASFEVMQY